MTMEISNPEEFEKKYVHNIYNNISTHFDKTRYSSWPIIEEFIRSFPKESLVADIGCGNGRNCLVRNDCVFIGTDISQSFINICQKKGIRSLVANNLSLPFMNNYFNYTMSIAVIHHFCNIKRRIKAISELIRITKIDGEILIYVWAKEQKKFSEEKNNDIFVPWNFQINVKSQKKIYQRYYHLFEKGELESLIKNFHNVNIIDKGYQKGNWYVIIKKNS